MAGVPYDYSTPGDRRWEGDDAHNACKAWLAGWRQIHGEHVQPPTRLAGPVGRAAVRLSAEGVGRVDLARLMWATGRDGDTFADAVGDTRLDIV